MASLARRLMDSIDSLLSVKDQASFIYRGDRNGHER